MPESFHTLQESLKEYLCEAQSDRYNSRNANLYKYNNMRLYIDPKKSDRPHFIIRIGISESMYCANTGEKITGGLGSDERYVRRWIEKNLKKLDMDSAWRDANKVESVNIDTNQN